jgi:hypothetical protein
LALAVLKLQVGDRNACQSFDEPFVRDADSYRAEVMQPPGGGANTASGARGGADQLRIIESDLRDRTVLAEVYVFGDFVGKVFALRLKKNGAPELQDLTGMLFPTGSGFDLRSLSSVGEDAAGELYLTSLMGSVFKIVPARP